MYAYRNFSMKSVWENFFEIFLNFVTKKKFT